MKFGPVVPSFGPTKAKICIVAEAPGEEESRELRPLVGPSGRELQRMMRTVGIELDDCFKTNVFSRQPEGSNLALFGTESPSLAARALGPLTTNPITYIADEWMWELSRLRDELAACEPNIIIALGNAASWALLGQQGITQLRGSIHATDFIPGRTTKVLPTYHPAAILQQWDWRVIALADLEKAHVEANYPEFIYDNTELWLNPTLADLQTFGDRYMVNATHIATDVETKRRQITCVSFSPNPSVSVCVPFWCEGPDPNYWPTPRDELLAWEWTRRWLEDPASTLVMQNGMYDTQYFIKHGIRPQGFTEDTMLAHHSKYSELRKGLGFLGSVYANVPSWKHMRTAKMEEVLKRDD